MGQFLDSLDIKHWRERAEKAEAENARLLAALKLLVADVADYPAWQRPCHAFDVARAALTESDRIRAASEREPKND